MDKMDDDTEWTVADDRFAFLAEWMGRNDIRIDDPASRRVSTTDPNADVKGYLATQVRNAIRVLRSDTSRWRPRECKDPETTLSWRRLPERKTFTCRWTTSLVDEGADVEGLMRAATAWSVCDLIETAATWDETFVSADYVLTHGDASNLDEYVRLIHWRFSAAPLRAREMVYLVVPVLRRAEDGKVVELLVAYISVTCPLCPRKATLSRNLMPSFDYVRKTDDGIVIDHILTTDIGGWVPRWMWNGLFRNAVVDFGVHESENIRKVLTRMASESADDVTGTAVVATDEPQSTSDTDSTVATAATTSTAPDAVPANHDGFGKNGGAKNDQREGETYEEMEGRHEQEAQARDVEYQRLMAVVEAHAATMKESYDAASKAHDDGDGATAKEMSTKGKDAKASMEAAKDTAMEFMFAHSNQNADGTWIDLHGLQVAYAEKKTKEFLQASKGAHPKVEVITGAGNHSGAGGVKIKPAILKLFADAHYQYEEKNAGSYIVTF